MNLFRILKKEIGDNRKKVASHSTHLFPTIEIIEKNLEVNLLTNVSGKISNWII